MWQEAQTELKRIASMGKAPESWPEFFFGFLILVAALALILGLLERWFPEQPLQTAALRRAGARTDFAYWCLGHALGKVTGLAFLIIAFAILLLKIPRFETLLAWQPIPLQAIEAFLIGDLFGYWSHRALHEIPWLWRFHAVHHSSKQVDWLAGGRVHPVETFLTQIVPFSVIFLLGFSPAIGIAFGPILGLHAIFQHANVRWDFGPLRWVITSPSWHRWHHAAEPEALNRNYSGLFPFYDRIFRTAHFPKRAPTSFGLANEPAFPEKLWDQLRYPWRRLRS
jgi:sterol desaturase/sphingolipid hydroxylase (fatty acid hydroxylase superfamily)